MKFIIVDSETYAAQFLIDEKKSWCRENGVPFFKVDICDEKSIEELVIWYNIDTIVNFAAESHVDNSIASPGVFYQTNVIGTKTLLEISRKRNIRFHQVGTDEVYGETRPDFWTENLVKSPELAPIRPSSPYSASKAAADLAVLAWHRTYGLNVTVSRCTNNFGRWQHPEKLIGTVVSKALRNEKIPVYGDGKQKRHWVHVDEHNRAILRILEHGESGRIYNISPPRENWIENIVLIRSILRTLGKPESLIDHISDRLGHDVTYFLKGNGISESRRIWSDDMDDTVLWFR